MLWSKRRSSRSPRRTQPRLSSPRRPSSSANSTTRLPLAPLDPLDPQASQSSLAAAAEVMSSSHHSSPSDNATKHHAGRQIDREAFHRISSRYVTFYFIARLQFDFISLGHLLLHRRRAAHSQIKLVEAQFPPLTRLLRTAPPSNLHRT